MAQKTRSRNSKKKGKRKQLRISRRVVNTKRHTTGYIIGGKFYTVEQTASLARRNMIKGVRVVGGHIQSQVGAKRLSDLPQTVVS